LNVVLIGYRAVGKTSVGRDLARRLCVPFHDTDEAVMQRTGKSVRELVDEGGWKLFRDEEKAAISCLSETDRCVIALGGGAVLDQENVRRLSLKGLFIWLRADAGTIVRRLSRDGRSGEQRPSLSGTDTKEEIPAILRAREEVYRQTAAFAVDTEERSIEEVSAEILQRINDECGMMNDE
jgi:shikimate kinase